MTFSDIFKKSFLEGYASTELGLREITVALLSAAVIGIFVFYCYRLLTRGTFYSRSFNVSLIAMTIITAGIILTIQSSIVVSLGMVGALSIVRFRTAIKDPMDLVFLFWSISVGIICGAGLTAIAIVLSLVVAAFIFIFDQIPVARAPKILVISATYSKEVGKTIEDIIAKYCKSYKEKSRVVSDERMDLIYELRVQDESELMNDILAIEHVSKVSLLHHDGDVTF